MYNKFIRPLLFLIDPEKVHHLVFVLLKILNKIPGVSYVIKKSYTIENPQLERTVFGLKFKNPVGLAAGFDKDAKGFKELHSLGFGFIEIGTLTPKPQIGNPKKRLFRLPKDQALINRMGFNNEGVEAAVKRLKNNKDVLIGGNIGKNKTTPNENAVDDYLLSLNALYKHVDYFVVNVSSPNTPNLRALQDKEPLKKLLSTLKKRMETFPKQKPILLKIAPDLNPNQLLDIVEIVETTETDGVIATNTTLSRDGLLDPNKNETGGLSGKPLTLKSTEMIRFLNQKWKGKIPIIAVGGIMTAHDALDKLKAGASLVQLYTGFIYQGPALIKSINKALIQEEK